MSAQILDGRAIGAQILDDVAQQVTGVKSGGWPPRLVSIKVGDQSAVELYIRNQRRAAERAGILFDEKQFPSDISLEELCAGISVLNVDPQVTGIIVQRPYPTSCQSRPSRGHPSAEGCRRHAPHIDRQHRL